MLGEKTACSLLGIFMCQIGLETRLIYLLTIKMHENLWYKIRKELRRTTLSCYGEHTTFLFLLAVLDEYEVQNVH